MNALNRHRFEMLERLLQLAVDYPSIVATNARAATLFALLPAIVATLRTFSRNQTSGHRTYRSGAQERATAATALRKAMRKIHNIAQVLDVSEHPGVRQKFKMPIDSYRALADSGRAFLQHATPIAHLFTERGRPATFLTELQTLIESMEAAAQYKHHGRLKQVAGTAGIESEARHGVKIMRELDAILADLLEENEPLLAAWKTAAKIQSPPNGERVFQPVSNKAEERFRSFALDPSTHADPKASVPLSTDASTPSPSTDTSIPTSPEVEDRNGRRRFGPPPPGSFTNNFASTIILPSPLASFCDCLPLELSQQSTHRAPPVFIQPSCASKQPPTTAPEQRFHSRADFSSCPIELFANSIFTDIVLTDDIQLALSPPFRFPRMHECFLAHTNVSPRQRLILPRSMALPIL